MELATDVCGGDDHAVIKRRIFARKPMLLSKKQPLSGCNYWALMHRY